MLHRGCKEVVMTCSRCCFMWNKRSLSHNTQWMFLLLILTVWIIIDRHPPSTSVHPSFIIHHPASTVHPLLPIMNHSALSIKRASRIYPRSLKCELRGPCRTTRSGSSCCWTWFCDSSSIVILHRLVIMHHSSITIHHPGGILHY